MLAVCGIFSEYPLVSEWFLVPPLLNIATMKKYAVLLASVLTAFSLSPSVLAEVGITDNCQEEVQELEDEIERDKDDYTAEARRKAKANLAQAKTNRANPAKCRENLRDARQDLRDGKK